LRLGIGRDYDLHGVIRDAVRIAVARRDINRRRSGLWARRLDSADRLAGGQRKESGAGQGGGVGHILLISPIQQVLSHIEYERSYQHDGDHPASHENEDLAAFASSVVSD
jgi:hypothetical protein